MAHYDLEEQEQLAQIKHFWNRYGNLIASVLIVVFGGIAAFNGWNYWRCSLTRWKKPLQPKTPRSLSAP
jgi:predicted negative regulator of RcsB-dependent stress response